MSLITNILTKLRNIFTTYSPRELDIVSHLSKDKDSEYEQLLQISKILKASMWSAEEFAFKAKLSSEQLGAIEKITQQRGLYLGRVIVILAALDQYVSEILECEYQKYFCEGSNIKSNLIRCLLHDQESQEQVHQNVYGLVHYVYHGLTDLIPFCMNIKSENVNNFEPFHDDEKVRTSILDDNMFHAKQFLDYLTELIRDLTVTQKMMISSALEGTLLMLSFLAVHVTKVMLYQIDFVDKYNLSDFLSVLYNANRFITQDEINHTNLSTLLIKNNTFSQYDLDVVVPILDRINFAFIKSVTDCEMNSEFENYYEVFKNQWIDRVKGASNITTQEIIRDTPLKTIIEISYDNFFANIPIYKKNSRIDYERDIDTSDI